MKILENPEKSQLRKALRQKEIPNCKYQRSCLQSCQVEINPVKLKFQKNMWIGQKYDRGKIMLVGINRNVGGKYVHLENEIEEWIQKEVIPGLRDPRTHQSHWLKYIKPAVERFLGQKMKDDEEAFQHIAFTEAIKCSPDWQLSSPTQKMIENCLSQAGYLKQEIDILRPRLIIVFGAETARLIRNIYQESNRSNNPEHDEDIYRITED